MADTARDYLAVIDFSGVGSWSRGPDKEKAIKDVIRRFKSDFKRYFNLKKGTELVINVLDVTGNDKVWWDACGFYGDNKDAPMKLEVVKHTLTRRPT